MRHRRQQIVGLVVVSLALHTMALPIEAASRVRAEVSGPSSVTIVWEIPEETLIQTVAGFGGFELPRLSTLGRNDAAAGVTTRGRKSTRWRPVKDRRKQFAKTTPKPVIEPVQTVEAEPAPATEAEVATDLSKPALPTVPEEVVDPVRTEESTRVPTAPEVVETVDAKTKPTPEVVETAEVATKPDPEAEVATDLSTVVVDPVRTEESTRVPTAPEVVETVDAKTKPTPEVVETAEVATKPDPEAEVATDLSKVVVDPVRTEESTRVPTAPEVVETVDAKTKPTPEVVETVDAKTKPTPEVVETAEVAAKPDPEAEVATDLSKVVVDPVRTEESTRVPTTSEVVETVDAKTKPTPEVVETVDAKTRPTPEVVETAEVAAKPDPEAEVATDLSKVVVDPVRTEESTRVPTAPEVVETVDAKTKLTPEVVETAEVAAKPDPEAEVATDLSKVVVDPVRTEESTRVPTTPEVVETAEVAAKPDPEAEVATDLSKVVVDPVRTEESTRVPTTPEVVETADARTRPMPEAVETTEVEARPEPELVVSADPAQVVVPSELVLSADPEVLVAPEREGPSRPDLATTSDVAETAEADSPTLEAMSAAQEGRVSTLSVDPARADLPGFEADSGRVADLPDITRVGDEVGVPLGIDRDLNVAIAAQRTPFSYHVYRRVPGRRGHRLTGGGGPREPFVDVTSRALRGIFTDTTTVPGETYSYSVSVIHTATGEEIYQTPEVTVTAHDNRAPGRVDGLTAEHAAGGIRLKWDALDDDEVSGYRVYRETVSLMEGVFEESRAGRESAFVQDSPELAAVTGSSDFERPLTEVDGNASFYVDGNLPPLLASGYRYSVAAVDPYSGMGQRSRTVRIAPPDVTAPAPPSGVQVRLSTDAATVEITWRASTSPDTAAYRIYRQVGQSEPARVRDTRTSTGGGFLARDPIDEQMDFPVRYLVAARDLSGNESATNASGWIRIPDTFAPDSPTISAISSANGAVELSWNAPAATDVTGYRVVRAAADGRPLPIRAVGNTEESSFTDRNVDIGGVYAYSIVAVDGEGNASRESRAHEQKAVGLIDPIAPSGLQVRRTPDGVPTLSWTPRTGSVKIRYVIFRSVSRDGVYSPASGVLSETSFTDQEGGSRDWYRVVARYVDGQVSPFSEVVSLSSEVLRRPAPGIDP